MNHPKRLATLLLPIAAVVALAACGPAPTSATESSQSTSALTPDAEVISTDDTVITQVIGGSATTHEPDPTGSSEDNEDQRASGPIAPELTGITGWINTDPFIWKSLRGKVVLIDFWTYTCVNCIRTFPFLKRWHEEYSEYGLIIVGVHSPEFEFEKIRENVEAAVTQYDLRYPIVQDNSFATWKAYGNRAWPSKYLIDKDGVVRYAHVGEGGYGSTEEQIRELLAEIGAPITQIPFGTVSRPGLDPQATTGGQGGQTREMYAGYFRNHATDPYIGNPEYYKAPQDTPTQYQDPGGHRNHLFYLHGLWTKGTESLTHARVTENLEDYIGLKFFGTTVNVVLNYDGDTPFKVMVTLAGDPIPEGFSGSDVKHENDGTSFLLVDEARMYRVVDLPQYAGTELRLASNSAQFSVFAFTFGSYAEGP